MNAVGIEVSKGKSTVVILKTVSGVTDISEVKASDGKLYVSAIGITEGFARLTTGSLLW